VCWLDLTRLHWDLTTYVLSTIYQTSQLYLIILEVQLAMQVQRITSKLQAKLT
jgi:hypothetical protein